VARAAGPLIHLGTRCGSLDEFVARFAPFATETSLVMPTSSEVAAGTEGRFVIHLKDRSPVMSGRCRVEEVKPVASGTSTGARLVMRVRLLGMDEASRGVHRQLLAFKKPERPPVVAAAPKPPLRIVRAPTLIGTVAPPIGTAPTLIGTLPPPLPLAAARVAASSPSAGDDSEKTIPSIRPIETQAPAAAFTLPANPLSELAAGDLASFIECTLFEADGELEAPAARPASDDAKTPRALTDDARPAASASEASEDIAPVPSPLRRRLFQAAPYALCTVIGVLVGTMLRGSHAPAPPPPAELSLASVAAAPPTPAPVAAPRAPAAPKVVVPVAPSGAGACTVSVTTEPADAIVSWGERTLGHTPLRGAPVPCGSATITLRHERYRDVTRDVTAEPSRTLAVDERLRRPMGTLVLSASPPRASFTVNQQPLGPGARTLSTWRYETVYVEATLAGYAPWRRTFYFKDETAKVEAHLVSLAKPPARSIMRR
jgi:hypothetical protein